MYKVVTALSPTVGRRTFRQSPPCELDFSSIFARKKHYMQTKEGPGSTVVISIYCRYLPTLQNHKQNFFKLVFSSLFNRSVLLCSPKTRYRYVGKNKQNELNLAAHIFAIVSYLLGIFSQRLSKEEKINLYFHILFPRLWICAVKQAVPPPSPLLQIYNCHVLLNF